MSEHREKLADISHDIWSHWMRWQFSICTKNEDGSMTIPKEKVERWTRQMNTPYAELSEGEKDSDREQADKILSVAKSLPEAIWKETAKKRGKAIDALSRKLSHANRRISHLRRLIQSLPGYQGNIPRDKRRSDMKEWIAAALKFCEHIPVFILEGSIEHSRDGHKRIEFLCDVSGKKLGRPYMHCEDKTWQRL